MKKITSLFLTLLLAIAITPSNADHHEKSVEQEIQAALKAGKITEKEAKEKLAYLERRKAESKKAPTKKKAAQEAARKKAAAKKKAESKKTPAKKKAAQEAARKKENKHLRECLSLQHALQSIGAEAVSYTHLTLPTKRIV